MVEEAETYTHEPTLPRRRKVPKKFNDGAPDHHHSSVQLSMLPDVRMANEEHHLGICKVTSVNTVCEIFNICKFPKTMLCEVHRLLRIYLTIPLTSATAERTFSTLQRLKSYLRSTMTQKRLNHLVLRHTHHQRTDDFNRFQIAQDFASINGRR